jgi:hypothetical protein
MVPHLLLTLVNTRIRSSCGCVSGAYSWRCLPSTPLFLKQIGLRTQPTSSSHVYQSLLCWPSVRWAYRALNLTTRTSSSVSFVNTVTRVEIAMYGVSSSHIVPNAKKESADGWVSELRNLAQKCKFDSDCCDNCQDTRLLTQIIYGVHSDVVRKKLVLDAAVGCGKSWTILAND